MYSRALRRYDRYVVRNSVLDQLLGQRGRAPHRAQVLLRSHPGLGKFVPINPPMGEEPCVFGGHHGVREVVGDLGHGHILIPPCRVPACPPGFDTALELAPWVRGGGKTRSAPSPRRHRP